MEHGPGGRILHDHLEHLDGVRLGPGGAAAIAGEGVLYPVRAVKGTRQAEEGLRRGLHAVLQTIGEEGLETLAGPQALLPEAGGAVAALELRVHRVEDPAARDHALAEVTTQGPDGRGGLRSHVGVREGEQVTDGVHRGRVADAGKRLDGRVTQRQVHLLVGAGHQ